jgi:hypothetical protein
MSAWEQSSGATDEWYTPKYIFDALGCTFDLDVAAPPRATHVPAAMSFSNGALEREWYGFVWMNPPFGGRNALRPWLDKFFAHGSGIALTPDRTSAPWFREAWTRTDAVLFLPKVRFLRPDGSEGKSPSTGTTLWAAGGYAVAALMRGARNGLGVMATPVRVE